MSDVPVEPNSSKENDPYVKWHPELAILVYIEGASPGYKYEIVTGKNVHYSTRNKLKVGKTIAIQYGRIQAYAEVVWYFSMYLPIESNSPKETNPYVDWFPELVILVYFEEAKPCYKYEIITGNNVHSSTRNKIKIGETIAIKYGKFRAYAEVVCISDSMEQVKNDFRLLIQLHQQSLRSPISSPEPEPLDEEMPTPLEWNHIYIRMKYMLV